MPVDPVLLGTKPAEKRPLIRSSNGIIWDAEKEVNPDSIGNKSRNSFFRNCYHSPIGIKFQEQGKGSIIRALNAVHQRKKYSFEGDSLTLQNALYESIRSRITDWTEHKHPFMMAATDILVDYAQDENEIKKLQKIKIFKIKIDLAYKIIKWYDKDAFSRQMEDERLIKMLDLLKHEITLYYNNDSTLLKVVEIIIFLMFEDIYYRPRWIQMLQDIYPTILEIIPRQNSTVLNSLCRLCELVQDFTFTEAELANIEEFH
jgi:hypothetical protein